MLRATSGSRAKRAYASLRFLAPTTSSSSSSRQAPWVLGAAGAGAAGCVAVGSIRAYASNRDPLLCEERKPLRKGEVKEADEGKGGFFDIQLPSLPSLPTLTSLTDSLTSLRTTFERLHGELTHAPTSAYARIQATSTDPKVHPELEWDAKVRLGNDVSHAERAFVRARRARMVEAFSRLMGEEVDERDIPVVAVAASGGGYRAMVNTLGAIEGAKETGLWDVVMYASGVSGSCWGLSSLYSIGQGDIKQTIDHVRNRIVTPFLDPETLDLLADHKTAEYILSGTVLKEISDSADSTVVDVYGTLVSARLFVPSKSTSPLSALDLKISGQRRFLDEGEQPLPIYCAIRHEVPHLDEVVEEAKSRTVTKKQEEDKEKHLKEAMKESKYMWFEVTPYEVGCDELGAWIPTWGFGRKFENGVNVERRPELSLTIFSGIFASAFCATLYSYFKEVRPLFLTLPYFKSIENWLLGNYKADLESFHPFPPAELANFLKGLDGKLREGAPESITKLDTLGLMDAGANLNIPYVPLFRRDCDIILAFDASADSQDLWFSRAEEYAVARELRTWPRVHHASLFDPTPDDASEKSASDLAAAKVDQAKAQELSTHPGERRKSALGDAQPRELNPEKAKEGSAPHSVQARVAEGKEVEGDGVPSSAPGEPKLGRCNIWIGSTKDEEGSCRNDDPSVEEVMARDGITLAYFPLVPGPELENPSEIWSTWKFDYTEEETQQLINLSKANFKSGEKQLLTTLRGIWQRKRQQRLADEAGQPVEELS